MQPERSFIAVVSLAPGKDAHLVEVEGQARLVWRKHRHELGHLVILGVFAPGSSTLVSTYAPM